MMNNFNKFIHGAVRKFYAAIDTHPMTVTVATVSATTFCGIVMYTTIEYLEQSNDGGTVGTLTNDQYDDDDDSGLYLGHRVAGEQYASLAKKPVMTMERARLQAMIENAQESSWRENIANATFAQERFMLPGRYDPDDDTDYTSGGSGSRSNVNNENNSSSSSSKINEGSLRFPNKNNFLKKIDERSREIMQQHQQQHQEYLKQLEHDRDMEREKEKRRKLTTKIW